MPLAPLDTYSGYALKNRSPLGWTIGIEIMDSVQFAPMPMLIYASVTRLLHKLP